MLVSLVSTLISLLFPGAPAWVSSLLVAMVPAVIDLVEELDDLKDRPGPERLEFVVENTKKLLDEGFDDVPEWKALGEDRRDRIIAGVTELVLFVDRVTGRKKGAATLRKALRKLKKGP